MAKKWVFFLSIILILHNCCIAQTTKTKSHFIIDAGTAIRLSEVLELGVSTNLAFKFSFPLMIRLGGFSTFAGKNKFGGARDIYVQLGAYQYYLKNKLAIYGAIGVNDLTFSRNAPAIITLGSTYILKQSKMGILGLTGAFNVERFKYQSFAWLNAGISYAFISKKRIHQ